MKLSIRKGSFPVHVTYRNGGFSNNLLGDKLTIEKGEDEIFLDFDMTKNLRTRNKSSNSYLDMIELQEDSENLKFIQLDSSLVLNPLKKAWNSMENPNLLVRIKISDINFASFSMRPDSNSGVVQLNVIKANSA